LRQVEEDGSFDEAGELRQIRDRLETLRREETVLTGHELDLVRLEIAFLAGQQRRLSLRQAPTPAAAAIAGAPADDFWAGWDDH
jgi:hypothetical protein